jgi:hypothetical protein
MELILRKVVEIHATNGNMFQLNGEALSKHNPQFGIIKKWVSALFGQGVALFCNFWDCLKRYFNVKSLNILQLNSA